MLVRRIARPLFATAFVADGVDTVRNPEPHVARTQAAYRQLSARVELPQLDPSQMTMLVRAHGAAVTVAAVALALGKAPRTAALALAALTVPVAAVNQPFVPDEGEEDRELGQVNHSSVVEAEQRVRLERFLRNLSAIGAALLVALDREGRPGVGWRVQHARVDRAAMREARAMLKDARREARSALREVKRAS